MVDVLFLRVLLAALVSWQDRQQQEALAYLIEEESHPSTSAAGTAPAAER